MNKINRSSLPKGFDIEGHRGCRGLLPENSLPAFSKALELRVTTLEMDLVISKDLEVVVSHEPYFNHEISLSPEGFEITEAEEKNHNLYRMTYDEIIKYDCGSKVHPRFPSQRKLKIYKPLFKNVIDLAETFASQNGIKIFYNVEIKSTPEGDNLFHPEVSRFSDLVCSLIEDKKIKERTIVQSFDIRALQYIHNNKSDFILSYLIENNLTPEENLRNLGFIPEVYSPEYPLVTKDLINLGRKNNMKIIPWTVNDAGEIKKLIDLGVDGIITDYPDLFS